MPEEDDGSDNNDDDDTDDDGTDDESADGTSTDIATETPLMVAVINGHLPAARSLIRHGADVNFRKGASFDSDTAEFPLSAAWNSENLDLARFLLKSGADPSLEWDSGETLLFDVVGRDDRPSALAFARLLVEKGVDVNHRASDGTTPLHHATERLEVVEFLLGQGVDVDAQDGDGHTPLMYWCDWTHTLHLVRMLVDKGGADLSLLADDGCTCFMDACAGGNILMAAYVLGKGMDLNHRCGAGGTALHYAVMSEELSTLSLATGHGYRCKHCRHPTRRL